MLKKRFLIPLALAVLLGLSGCGGSSTWYKLDSFLAMKPDAIVKELENNQGLKYEKQGSDNYAWVGTPKDALSESGAHEEIAIYKKDGIAYTPMTKDELLSGDAEIYGAEIVFACEAADNGSIQSTKDEIIKKCGFGNQAAEGESYLGYTVVGSCKLNGNDAIWEINMTDSFVGVSVVEDDSDRLETAVAAIEDWD